MAIIECLGYGLYALGVLITWALAALVIVQPVLWLCDVEWE